MLRKYKNKKGSNNSYSTLHLPMKNMPLRGHYKCNKSFYIIKQICKNNFTLSFYKFFSISN